MLSSRSANIFLTSLVAGVGRFKSCGFEVVSALEFYVYMVSS